MSGTEVITDRMIDAAAGLDGGAAIHRNDRRLKRRHPYAANVGLMLVAPDGRRFDPIVLQGRDLSVGGISVVSRQMIHPGSGGAVQLVRSDGTIAIVGGVVRHCLYLGGMVHATGIEFGPLPPGVAPAEFVGADGWLELFGPSLTENAPGGAGPLRDA